MPERIMMKNKIETFKNDRFGNVRIILMNEEPWFVGKDVAVILGYSNPQKAVRDHVDHEDRTVNESFTVNGTPITLINESGLYSLIISSKLPDARAFKRWITHEVLPLIRKTGGYISEPLLERIQKDPAVIFEFADALVAEKNRSTALAAELALAKPKADYFDAFINPDDCTNIRTTAKEMKIPERQFVKFLLNEKFLFRSPNGTLLPYNKPSNEGLFIVRDYYTYRYIASQTFFTPMGKDTIRIKYLQKHGDPVKRPA